MNMAAVNKFKSICDFPELVEYLRDELDWPIETDDFEEMTFEYSAEELGLDARTAPKFLEIHRLRPLDKNQPWGIFFIRFEESKLPVVALRRLLSKLALKKRSTSNASDRASWHENDLLLISQTGGTEEKRISFAHFASNPEKTDLPILKVLGWDNDDTGLKIDYVIETLREKLLWPDDPANSDAWRSQWRDAFTLKNREVIQSSKDLAEKLGKPINNSLASMGMVRKSWLGKTIADFDRVWEGSGIRWVNKTHSWRKIYASYSHTVFNRHGNLNSWIQEVLGHDRPETSLSYANLIVVSATQVQDKDLKAEYSRLKYDYDELRRTHKEFVQRQDELNKMFIERLGETKQEEKEEEKTDQNLKMLPSTLGNGTEIGFPPFDIPNR